MIMSLEGPRLRALDGAHAELLGVLPRPYWRVRRELAGILDPVLDHKLVTVGALLFGAWLAGSKRGQRIMRRVFKRKR